MARLIDKLYGDYKAEQTIVSHFNKGQEVKQGPDAQEVLEKLNENFNKGIISDEIYEGACNELDQLIKARTTKYIRREGTKGNYKYVYKEGQGKLSSDKDVDIHDFETVKKVSEHAGISRQEYIKLHPGTKKELLSNYLKDQKGNKEDDFWENKGKKDENKLKVGDSVKIPRNLTSDPHNRQGQIGKITKVDEKNDEVIVEFENGGSGRYQLDAVEKVKKEVEGKKEFTSKDVDKFIRSHGEQGKMPSDDQLKEISDKTKRFGEGGKVSVLALKTAITASINVHKRENDKGGETTGKKGGNEDFYSQAFREDFHRASTEDWNEAMKRSGIKNKKEWIGDYSDDDQKKIHGHLKDIAKENLQKIKKDQINPAKQSKKELYEAVNKKYGTSFKPGDIEEFEDNEFRKELTEDDIKSIIDDEKKSKNKEDDKYKDWDSARHIEEASHHAKMVDDYQDKANKFEEKYKRYDRVSRDMMNEHERARKFHSEKAKQKSK